LKKSTNDSLLPFFYVKIINVFLFFFMQNTVKLSFFHSSTFFGTLKVNLLSKLLSNWCAYAFPLYNLLWTLPNFIPSLVFLTNYGTMPLIYILLSLNSSANTLAKCLSYFSIMIFLSPLLCKSFSLRVICERREVNYCFYDMRAVDKSWGKLRLRFELERER